MKPMTRAAVVGLALFVALPLSPAGGQESVAKPNILVFMADDWSHPHAGAYGDQVVRTPTFDRIAREGVLFRNAFVASPSCTPSRASVLTGRPVHQLEEGGNLWGFLPATFEAYPDLLEASGYVVGFTRKGWGPGDFKAGSRLRNPAGQPFVNFAAFLDQVPKGRPFAFWFGSQDPHRPYDKGAGAAAGRRVEEVVVPGFLPDTPEVRSDILDYYYEVERVDRESGEIIKALEASGQLDNTIVVFTSDNGMPFPRAKANLHDGGTHVPLAIRFPSRVQAPLVLDDFVVLTDLAPTLLEAAGLKPPPQMTGRSLLPLMAGERQAGRDRVFLERERHAHVRRGNLSYPARAVRTKDFLYIRNLRPDRWPAGDPEMVYAVGEFGDIDGGPTKELLLARRSDPAIARFFHLATDKRPAEELYDLRTDPHQLENVAAQPAYAGQKRKLRAALDAWMRQTADPRSVKDDDRWDTYPYFGKPGR
jgi:arylsulfatase A-like enzyme